MKFKKEKIIELVWFIVITCLFILSIYLIKSGTLQQEIHKFGFFAPFIVVILKMTTLIIAPLGGTPLYILSGVLFGSVKGFLICLLGDILGSSICFWIGRKYGMRVVRKFVGETLYIKVQSFVDILIDTKSFIKARIAFISLPEILAYGASLSKINFYKFILLHTLFYIPIDFILVFFGSRLLNLTGYYNLLYFVFFAIISIVGFFALYKDYEKIEGM